MDAHLQQANRLVIELQGELGMLGGPNSSEELESSINRKLEQLTQHCERLDILLNKEPATRRHACKVKVDQLRYDCQSLHNGYQGYRRRKDMQFREQQQRAELMSQTFTANSRETSILLDAALRENTSLQSSTQGLDNLIDQGHGILASLRDQRSILKNAHRKMLDVMTTLGLSNTVMRLIERRSTQDKFLMFGGMILSVVVMVMFYRWWHS